MFIKSTTFHTGHGGLETQNKALCEGLARRGHFVTVFAPQKELKVTEITESGVNYVFIPCVFRTLFVEFIKNHWYKESVKVFENHHTKHKFDLVLSQSSAGIGIVQNKRRLEIPVVSISHGTIIGEIKTRLQNNNSLKDTIMLVPDIGYALYNFFIKQRAFILGSNKVIAVSNFVRDELLDETYAPEDKIFVIHNGVDSTKINNAEPTIFDDSKSHAVYVGRIETSKGLADLVEIFSDRNLSDFNLDIVGTGPFDKNLKKLVDSKNLAKRIKLHGKLGYNQVLQILKSPSVKVFLSPTKRIEGFPMTIVEAMFAGLPVISYAMGGVSDAIENGVTGYLVSPGNIDLFKKRTLDVLKDDNLRENLSKRALLKAQKEFSIDTMLDNYEKVFLEVVK